jgi:hypothetical protein
MKPSLDYGWRSAVLRRSNCDDNNVAKRIWEIGDIVDVFEALGRPQISSVLRVRNMLEIVLGTLVVCLRLLVRCRGFMEQGIALGPSIPPIWPHVY